MLPPVGDLYLFFHPMSVYPILVSAIVWGRPPHQRQRCGNLCA